MMFMRTSPMVRSPSLQAFPDYRALEASNAMQSSVSSTGELLEYETLELRVHPPNVEVDNTVDDFRTIITIDSANRPGTLVEVVQHLTELGLNVKSARISSEGAWFVDVFEVTDNNRKVTDPRKLESIKQMLRVRLDGEESILANADETDEEDRVETTVFELAGQDKPGLLADVTDLLTTNGCNVRSAAVWTYKDRVAFVLSVTEKGTPIQDGRKLQRLRQLLFQMMDSQGESIVNIKKVRGEVHHDRRLHQLMLSEEEKEWGLSQVARQHVARQRSLLCRSSSLSSCPEDGVASSRGSLEIPDFRSPKHSKPDIQVRKDKNSRYWIVKIHCKDREKLLFDTVCTLADMDYDVYHATIDGKGNEAFQEYFVKPRLGLSWDATKAEKLQAMMESSIQRRFPKGLKIHIHSVDRFGCLSQLTRVLQEANLTVTRAKVKTSALNKTSGHTLYLMDASGKPPSSAVVAAACARIGGRLVEDGVERGAALSSSPELKFSFSFLNREWTRSWEGAGGSSADADAPLSQSPASSNGSS